MLAGRVPPPPPLLLLALHVASPADHKISRWMPGANFPSHNIAGGGCAPVVHVNYTDPHSCQSACDSDPACKEWTFGTVAHSHVCCHKDCTGGCPQPDDCPEPPCTSGVKDPSTWPRPPPPLPPAPPAPAPPAECLTMDRSLSFQLADTPGIPWQLGDYAVRQTNCVYLAQRYWCYADVVPFASKLYPNTYNTSTHLFSASENDLVFT